eukprot:4889160-Amphidinium_carterae.1
MQRCTWAVSVVHCIAHAVASLWPICWQALLHEVDLTAQICQTLGLQDLLEGRLVESQCLAGLSRALIARHVHTHTGASLMRAELLSGFAALQRGHDAKVAVSSN